METDSTVLSNARWAQRVGAACTLPDQRLNHRLSAIIADALNHPNASIPQASGGDAGQAKGTDRCFTVSEAARRELLDRLLALNHQRHREEVEAEREGQKLR